MLQKSIEDVRRVAQRARNDDAVESGELIAGEVVIRHTTLDMEVLAVESSVERPHRHYKSQAIRRGHLAATKDARQRNTRLRVYQTGIGPNQGFVANVVLLHPRQPGVCERRT